MSILQEKEDKIPFTQPYPLISLPLQLPPSSPLPVTHWSYWHPQGNPQLIGQISWLLLLQACLKLLPLRRKQSRLYCEHQTLWGPQWQEDRRTKVRSPDSQQIHSPLRLPHSLYSHCFLPSKRRLRNKARKEEEKQDASPIINPLGKHGQIPDLLSRL